MQMVACDGGGVELPELSVRKVAGSDCSLNSGVERCSTW